MADSILRLKVESQEYDSKLKRAAEGIQRLVAKIHDSQGEFAGLDKEQREFISNLQYMNTVSQTATGKVRELETAYKGLQTMYNGFNSFEKNSEEGKILAEQLTESNSGGMVAGSPYVTGETIFLGLSNYLRRNGYGELITTRARR